MMLNINNIIGIIGVFLLMVTVVVEDQSRRKWWLISAIFLIIYNVTQKDFINSSVNGWIIIINVLYLIKWRGK